jgi:hypothetical protein
LYYRDTNEIILDLNTQYHCQHAQSRNAGTADTSDEAIDETEDEYMDEANLNHDVLAIREDLAANPTVQSITSASADSSSNMAEVPTTSCGIPCGDPMLDQLSSSLGQQPIYQPHTSSSQSYLHSLNVDYRSGRGRQSKPVLKWAAAVQKEKYTRNKFLSQANSNKAKNLEDEETRW